MASRESAFIDITPEVLLKAYSCGIFPMAESADDPALYWIEPERRGIMPLDRFHLPGRLARTIRSTPFTVVVDRDFDAVIEGCAQPQPGRSRTWINGRIRTLYRKLYQRGDCHTVEVYDGEVLIGGLYGVSLGRAFFGERAMLQKSLWCIWSRGSRLAATVCWTPSLSPSICGASARLKYHGRSIIDCLTPPSSAKPTSLPSRSISRSQARPYWPAWHRADLSIVGDRRRCA